MTRVESALKSTERVASPSQVKTQGWEAMTWWLRHQAAPSGTAAPAAQTSALRLVARNGRKRNRLKAKLTRTAAARPKSTPAAAAAGSPGRVQTQTSDANTRASAKLSGPIWQVNDTRGPKSAIISAAAPAAQGDAGCVARSHRQTSATERSDSAAASHWPPTRAGRAALR